MADEGRREHGSLGGLIGGIAEFLEKLEKLAEEGREFSGSGNIPGPGRSGASRGAFSVRIGGLGGGDRDHDFRVEPSGAPRRDRASSPPPSEEREPLIDAFDEGDRLVIVAEMPGIAPDEVRIDLVGSTLTLAGEHGGRKYRKQVELFEGVQRDQLSVSYRNGIIEISAAKPRT